MFKKDDIVILKCNAVNGYREFKAGERFIVLDAYRSTAEVKSLLCGSTLITSPSKFKHEKEKDMNANSIKTGSFIIGSIGPNGLSFANHPMVHGDSLSAKMEAERLAKSNQGKKFIVVEVKGIAEVANVVWR